MSDATIKQYNFSLDGQDVNSIRNFKLDVIDTDPTATQAYQLKFNSVDGNLKIHDGTDVKTVAYTDSVLSTESATLASLPADTATEVVSSNLNTIDLASVRQNERDLTSSILLDYSGNKIILQSSIELSNLDIRLVGRKTITSSIPDDAATGGDILGNFVP